MIEVEWDGEPAGAMFVAAVEVEALDRSRLLRDVASALVDHHVNIVVVQHRTPAPTAWPRCASSSSWPTPATSRPCSRTIKRIDGVYDAYRLIPGAAVPVA